MNATQKISMTAHGVTVSATDRDDDGQPVRVKLGYGDARYLTREQAAALRDMLATALARTGVEWLP